jgi:ABC-type molybdate transport system substrate-binding protein
MTRPFHIFVFGIAFLVLLQSCDTAGSSEPSTTDVSYKVKVDSVGGKAPENLSRDISLWYSVKSFRDKDEDGGISISDYEDLVDSTTVTVNEYVVEDTIEVKTKNVDMVCVYGWVKNTYKFTGTITASGFTEPYEEVEFYETGVLTYLPSSDSRGPACVSGNY